MDAPTTRHYRFEGFTLDTRARELKAADATVVPLNARAFDVLCLLLRHRDRVVGKDELLETVWAGRVVEENTLTQAISGLRRALGSGAGDHRYIVTVPGRGYRFVAEASEDDPAAPRLRRAADTQAPLASPSGFPWRGLVAGALALAMLALVVAYWPRRTQPGTAPGHAAAPITLAVRPFRSLSGGPPDPELELGLADTLITRLSRSPGISIPTLSSAQDPVVAGLDSRAAGRELGVAYVVEGTTQRVGRQVRVNARLISVAEGKVVWSDSFDAGLAEVFRLQDAVGQGIAHSLALGASRLPPRGGDSPCDGADATAYRAYLRGQYQLQRPNPSRIQLALAEFREAIDRDPTCARAWAGTAFAYRALVMTGDRDPREYFPLARAAMEKALAIDPGSAEAWASKGFIEFWYDWDWPAAEASLRHAIALNPNLAEAHIALAHLLFNLRRDAEAGVQARRAVALDPFSPLVNALASSYAGRSSDVVAARRQLQRTLEREPDNWVALRVRGVQRLAKGDGAGAVQDLERALVISEGSSQILNVLVRAHVVAGNRDAAQRVMAELERRRREGYVPATSLAAGLIALGDRARAIGLLEQGYAERDVRLSFLAIDPQWRPLYGEPRFQALARRLKLPATAVDRISAGG